MTNKSTLKNVTLITPEIKSKIIWGVYDKFRVRNPNEVRANHGDKGNYNTLIIADIFLYIVEKYSKAESSNDHVEGRIISAIAESLNANGEFKTSENSHQLIKDASEVAKKIKEGASGKSTTKKRWKKVVEITSFQKFINHLILVYQCPETKISCSLPRVQLEALCLYGWDATYEQVCESHDFYKHKGKIRFIPTDLRGVFELSLRKVLNAFYEADVKGGSEKMLNRAGEIFINETARLCADFSNGKIPTRSYLKDLLYSMEICESGFGISIPEFSKYWDISNSAEGKDILEMNKKQAEGFLNDGKKTKKESPWIRIFFVKGVNGTKHKLSDAENKMLKTQLEYKVEVFVVFEDAWRCLSKQERERCDFAVFRIDNCPSLMSTQFENGEAEGIFYTDESMPEHHYKEHLEKILSKENKEHIYEPELINNKVILGSPLKENHLEGVIGKLEKIYKKSK